MNRRFYLSPLAAMCVQQLAWAASPSISKIANAEGESPLIAPNTWVEIKGANLAPSNDTRTWQSSDFVNGQMPTNLGSVSVTVNGKAAYVYYISASQINILTPPDALPAAPQIVVTNNGATASATASAAAISPSFFVLSDGQHLAAVHTDGSLIGRPVSPSPATHLAPPNRAKPCFSSPTPSARPACLSSVARLRSREHSRRSHP